MGDGCRLRPEREAPRPYPLENMSIQEEFSPELCLRKLQTHPGVTSWVLMNAQAIPVKADGMDAKKMVQMAALISELVHMTQKFLHDDKTMAGADLAAHAADPGATDTLGQPAVNEHQLVTLRLHSLRGEIIVAPDKDFTLVTCQFPNPTETKKKEEAAEASA